MDTERILTMWFNKNTDIIIFGLIANSPGFDVNVTDSNGITALYWAAFHDDIDRARILLSISSIDVNRHYSSKENVTALHMATKSEIVDELIKKGANVNAVTDTGNTPIMVNKEDDPISIQLLVAAGASLKQVNNHGKTVFDRIPEKYHYILKAPFEVMLEKIKFLTSEEKSKCIQAILASY